MLVSSSVPHSHFSRPVLLSVFSTAEDSLMCSSDACFCSLTPLISCPAGSSPHPIPGLSETSGRDDASSPGGLLHKMENRVCLSFLRSDTNVICYPPSRIREKEKRKVRLKRKSFFIHDNGTLFLRFCGT